MKTGNLIINWLLISYATSQTERLFSPFDKWRRGDFNFQTFYWIGKNLVVQPRLFKNPNFSPLFLIGKNLEAYTAQGKHFKIQILNLWLNFEKFCPNLSLIVENKIANSHKKEDGHILSVNDWDIPFPKRLRICQWIGKNIFHWRQWYEPIGNFALPQNVWLWGSEDIYF